MFSVDVDFKAAERKLNDVSITMTGKAGNLKPAYRAMGVFVCVNYFTANFDQQGHITGSGWQKIHPITSVLRVRKGPKFKTMAEIDAARLRVQKPLQDTGKLKQSFMPGRAKSAFKVENDFVIAGSADPRAKAHNEGYDTQAGTFWTDDRKRRLDANVRKRLPGAPKKKPGKKKTHANPLYGQLYAIGKSIGRKGGHVPARPLVQKPLPNHWVARIVTVGEREIMLLVQRKRWN